jgi:hypothetical protein
MQQASSSFLKGSLLSLKDTVSHPARLFYIYIKSAIYHVRLPTGCFCTDITNKHSHWSIEHEQAHVVPVLVLIM